MLIYSQRLANAVKKTRSELGLTQEEVADKCDTDVRTIINMEMGRGNPMLRPYSKLFVRLKQTQENSLTMIYKTTARPFAVYACSLTSAARRKLLPYFP